jgi:predicted GTPase
MRAANIQCESILSGIRQLEEYLQDKFVRESLELGVNAETTQYSDFLSRLKLSLTQYTAREKNLVYVGFMGHFSTGKSSTINSLLNLNPDSKDSRKVALNPVDQSITLITHEENRDALMNVTKESLVSIRSSFIENDFLKNVVIADTPGTGDPILVHAIAQDFLPICDLIVYFFSSTAALTSTDLTLLTEKSSELPFIPIKFVITRADEFRKDRSKSLDGQNFDNAKAQVFLNDLGQRVRSLFKNSSDISTDNFILVDNIDKYNLDFLQQVIVDFANQSNVSVQLDIHTHKIMYFRASAEKLQDFFCSFLQSKLRFLAGVLNGADANIDRFRGKIQVTNNNLTQSWNEKFKKITDTKKELLSEKIFSEISFPNLINLLDRQKIRTFELELKRLAVDRQGKIQDKIAEDLITQIRKITSENRDSIKRLSSLDDLLYSQSLMLDFSSISKKKLIEDADFSLPSGLINDSLSVIRDLDEKLVEYYNDFAKNMEYIQGVIENQVPLKDFKLVVDDAVNSLAQDFDNYFDAITVYRTGIFSLGAKDAIAKLGLGAQMDYLEADELTESKKLSIKEKAQECLFPRNSELLNGSFKSLNVLMSDLDKLRSKMKDLSAMKRLPTNIIPASDVYVNSAFKSAEQKVFENLENALREIQESLNSKIHELTVMFSEKWKLEIEEMKKDRKKRIRTFIIVTCIAITCVYLVFLYLAKVDFANNWATVLISGLVINLISNPIGSWLDKTRCSSF